MVERDPDKFLSSLVVAIRNRMEADDSLKPQYHLYSASISAVSLRLSALDSLAAKFEEASINVNTNLEKRKEQDQILFDFFSNASASFESFCSGSYFVGAVLYPNGFDFGQPKNRVLENLKKIGPESAHKSYQQFAPNSDFTIGLRELLGSDKYKMLEMMRNLLLHRIHPGRTIRLSTHTSLRTQLILIYGSKEKHGDCTVELDSPSQSMYLNWMGTLSLGKGTGWMLRSANLGSSLPCWQNPKGWDSHSSK